MRDGESVFSEHTLDRKIPGAFKGHVICLESLEYTAKMTGYLLRSCAYDYLLRLAGDAPGRVHISCYLMAEGRLPLRIALEEEEIGVLAVDFRGALLTFDEVKTFRITYIWILFGLKDLLRQRSLSARGLW